MISIQDEEEDDEDTEIYQCLNIPDDPKNKNHKLPKRNKTICKVHKKTVQNK